MSDFSSPLIKHPSLRLLLPAVLFELPQVPVSLTLTRSACCLWVCLLIGWVEISLSLSLSLPPSPSHTPLFSPTSAGFGSKSCSYSPLMGWQSHTLKSRLLPLSLITPSLHIPNHQPSDHTLSFCAQTHLLKWDQKQTDKTFPWFKNSNPCYWVDVCPLVPPVWWETPCKSGLLCYRLTSSMSHTLVCFSVQTYWYSS